MTSLSDRFVEALRTFDADGMTKLLSSDAVGWRNLGNRDRSVDEIVHSLQVEHALLGESALRVRHQSPTDDGFVVQLQFEGKTRSGLPFSIPICIVARVLDGHIVGFNEYADESSTLPLRQELSASAQPNAEVN